MKNEILYRFIAGTTTPEEDKEVIGWVESSVENRDKFLKEQEFFYIINWNMEEEKTPTLSWEEFIAKHKK